MIVFDMQEIAQGAKTVPCALPNACIIFPFTFLLLATRVMRRRPKEREEVSAVS